jgi:hypothetical protein
LGGLGRCPTQRHDDVHVQTDQIGCERLVPILLAFGPSGLDGDVPTFDVAQIAQTLAERVEATQPYRVGRVARIYVTHPGYLPCLLCLDGHRRGQGPQRESAEERAPVHHWMT